MIGKIFRVAGGKWMGGGCWDRNGIWGCGGEGGKDIE